jgi:hypothetical protein
MVWKMEQLGTPQGLILFASDRLWPQLDALAQWGKKASSIHLFTCLGDEGEGGPADRLALFIATSFPKVALIRHEPVSPDDPAELLAQVESVIEQEGSWLVETSGTTRLVYAGIAQLLQRHPDLSVLHREADGPWYQIGPDGGAWLVENVDPDAMEQFTVEGLLGVTWSDEERAARVMHSKINPAISEAARRVVEGADWESEFNHAIAFLNSVRDTHVSQGHLFETFVMAICRHMGVDADDVVRSAILWDGAEQVQEVDVVVNSHGRLHVIDCKLTTDEMDPRIGDQIRSAYATAQFLGDGADQVILLRPNRVINESFRSLADAYGIQIIDSLTLQETGLADVLYRMLRADQPVSTRDSKAPQHVRVPLRFGLVDLHAEFVQSRDNFRLYDLNTHVVLKAATRLTTDRIVAEVLRATDGMVQVMGQNRNNARTIVTLVLALPTEQRDVIRTQLSAVVLPTR